MASAWEMQIKLQLGKLHLRLPLAEVIASQQQTNELQVLPVALSHVLALQGLPAHHLRITTVTETVTHLPVSQQDRC